MTLTGFERSVQFNRDEHKVDITEMDKGDCWPPGSVLSLPSEAERPGSFVITLDAPLGGRSPKLGGRLSVPFEQYVVSVVISYVKGVVVEYTVWSRVVFFSIFKPTGFCRPTPVWWRLCKIVQD